MLLYSKTRRTVILFFLFFLLNKSEEFELESLSENVGFNMKQKDVNNNGSIIKPNADTAVENSVISGPAKQADISRGNLQQRCWQRQTFSIKQQGEK